MKRIIYIIAGVALFVAAYSCGDTSNIGSSILQDQVEIIMDSSFMASGQSLRNARVQSRTTTQLLGVIEAPEYGQFSSEFVTQFMPSAQIDTTGFSIEDIDSFQYIMAVPNGAYVGDSVLPMGLNVYLLNKQLPSPIYSDFDPTGYYDENPIASEIYSSTAIHESDSVFGLSYRYIYVNMPLELGQKLYQSYLDDPSSYLSPSEFIKIFPGIYVANSFGSGRVVRIASSIMRLYYHIDGVSANTGNDTTVYMFGNFYAVTPEIITNNDISYAMSSSLSDMIDQGKSIVVAPTGSDVELVFPALDIINSYKSGAGSISMINTLTMSIPAIEISNDYGIAPPDNLLLVLKSKRDEFIDNNELPDDETSFYATYDSTNKTYDFTSMRNYVLWLLQKETITADDYTFVLMPVEVTMGTNTSSYYYYYTTTYLETVAPYVQEPAMVELDIENSKIILTYSRQSKRN